MRKKAISIVIVVFLALLLILFSKGSDAGNPSGVYEDPFFSFSGGSGRIEIDCENVTLSEGKAIARVSFSSPNYIYVKVDGVKYEGEHQDGRSSFDIPITLDSDMKIIGCTTAMSTPHEIEYEIFVSLDREKDTKGEATEAAPKSEETPSDRADTDVPPEIPGLSIKDKLPLKYAECFDIYYYEKREEPGSEYKVICVADGNDYLILPEGKTAPEKLPGNIQVISSGEKVYLAATAVMSLFNALDSLDHISYSGTEEQGWYIEEAKEAMKDGRITYAGKYSAPDYEMLLTGKVDLAIESTMILRSPEVKETLIKLGIPVFIDYSAYEKKGFGRTEWIKAYAAILGKEAEAERFFDEELSKYENSLSYENTGKKVAFIYMNSEGLAVVRKNDDYIVDLIRVGGGVYAFDDMEDNVGDSQTTAISVESLYEYANDADFIIYNNTIDPSVQSVSDLKAKSVLFGDFKAVKEGNVYMTDSRMYQSTDRISRFAIDINKMLIGGNGEYEFLSKLPEE